MNLDTKSVLIVDDHPLVAKATKHVLEKNEKLQIIGMAFNGKECLEMMSLHQPDIVFLDYRLPDMTGVEIAEQIKGKYPNTLIVIFSGIDITDLTNKLIELKVSGIISKESSETTIMNMVNCILDGHTMLPLSMYHQMRMTSSNQNYIESKLNDDEIKIMTLIVKGATHEQVADEIHLSKRSVDNYLKKIYGKLNVKTKVQAIEKFVQMKIQSN
ncbi:response regulator transcription factor [Chengkuizengella axinellae]|uniref:Response regulator transcription factor n=1 Tax=Chengkuizengella axinellae TaxID=3064388 RepID=A0ABT9J5A4_9BACL|nr:response regulator transcription factor [Chengkuizengella sp. 2205SS18-9]MDP5276799.1 response regulator transcription factor [Chengkuizengella sp. 2205SS18-9]